MPLPLLTNVAPDGNVEVLKLGMVPLGSVAEILKLRLIPSVTLLGPMPANTGGWLAGGVDENETLMVVSCTIVTLFNRIVSISVAGGSGIYSNL